MEAKNSAKLDKSSTSRRPKIPIEIQRDILVEAGHRCAVCGEGCPLERAHIIPWCKTKDHSFENLICLCANCHQRADNEKWGTKALQRYKKEPWILRRKTEHDQPNEAKKSEVEIELKMKLADFDDKNRKLLVYALAAFLDIPPESVEILSLKEGSTIASIKISNNDALRLMKSYLKKDEDLKQYLSLFGLEEVRIDKQKYAELLLDSWRDGSSASFEELIELLYPDLKMIAHRMLDRGRGGLMTTEIVHEALLRVWKRENIKWESRNHFLQFMAMAMRHILIDQARMRMRQKKGTPSRVLLDHEANLGSLHESPENILALNKALEEMAKMDPALASIVQLRFFAGATLSEVANATGFKSSQVKRQWDFAKSWLTRYILKEKP